MLASFLFVLLMMDADLPENKEVDHERRQTGEKPYTCSYPGCGRKFARKERLRLHERMHTGEKPFTCSYPGYVHVRKFAEWTTLKNHKRTHTGEKPHPCNYPGCVRKFAQLSSLKHHERTHTGKTILLQLSWLRAKVCEKGHVKAPCAHAHR